MSSRESSYRPAVGNDAYVESVVVITCFSDPERTLGALNEADAAPTVTVCGAFQLACVNLRLARLTVPSAVLLLEIPMFTSAVGDEVSLTVKLAVLPDSDVKRPLVGATTTPAESLSRFVTLTC